MSIIKVENLSKKYLISHESQERYTAMRDVVANKVKKIFSFPKSLQAPKATKEEFYALRDINFEIEQGDRVGIIGRNGAGKSTLLKVLSRITEPSTGKITINGRVASLLEVGTGFHPELTGRENIYLNGAILGMSRIEIRKKFDEIVDFAEVEKFLDTPVKRYSSGMYVRLAFAVAAHLEPEILIVDEVLAVGDAQFQKKCLGKMEDVSKNEGRTVLFVSHNMDAIKKLCNGGVLLDKGKMITHGTIQNIICKYFDSSNYKFTNFYKISEKKPSISKVELDSEAINIGIIKLKIHFQSPFELCPPIGGFVIYNLLNIPIYGSNTRYHSKGYNHTNSFTGILQATISDAKLHTGSYKISVWLADMYKDYDEKQEAIFFEYTSPKSYSSVPDPLVIGSVDINCIWSINEQ